LSRSVAHNSGKDDAGAHRKHELLRPRELRAITRAFVMLIIARR